MRLGDGCFPLGELFLEDVVEEYSERRGRNGPATRENLHYGNFQDRATPFSFICRTRRGT